MGGDDFSPLSNLLVHISIHASLTGGDPLGVSVTYSNGAISIHASLTGGDKSIKIPWTELSYFNPRLPHGRRPLHVLQFINEFLISIHASLTGGDGCQRAGREIVGISIHASLTGGDAGELTAIDDGNDFNPRLPHGRRLCDLMDGDRPLDDFNPRLPHGRRQRKLPILIHCNQ